MNIKEYQSAQIARVNARARAREEYAARMRVQVRNEWIAGIVSMVAILYGFAVLGAFQ